MGQTQNTNLMDIAPSKKIAEKKAEIEKLKKDLAMARKAEKDAAQKKFITPFLELKNKAFFFRRLVSAWKIKQNAVLCGFIQYGQAKVREVDPVHGHGRATEGHYEFKAIIPIKSIFACSQNGELTWEGARVQANVNPFFETRNFDELTRDHVCEISSAFFEQEMLVSANLAEMVMHRWSATMLVEPLNKSIVSPPGDLDAPHIKLENNESSILGESIFRVSSDTYLVTPNSVKLAEIKIDDAEQTELRCAHLLQPCDMAYVDGKRRDIKSLRRKLGL